MQTKDIREKILNFMREESYAPMTSEELVDALGHDVNPNKFWDELLALEQNGEIIKTRFETYAGENGPGCRTLSADEQGLRLCYSG